MAGKYRVGIIGFAHMHINNVAQRFAAHPQIEMAACADIPPVVPELRVAPYTREWNKQFALKDIGVAKDYDCYSEMLESEKLDVVICCSENAHHPTVVDACAKSGVAVCVEKPMARSLSDAIAMARSVEAAGSTMMVNWPMAWEPAARKCQELIDAGAIGRVLQVKSRLGHTGPLGTGAKHAGVSDVSEGLAPNELGAVWWHNKAAGGGAMIDFCCYGCMISRWFIGEPAVSAVGMRANLNSSFGDADDNGAIIVRFPSAMGLFEGTWTTWDHGVGGGPIVYGTEGTLVMEGRDGKPVVRQGSGSGTTIHEAPPLPEDRKDIAHEFVRHMETGEPLHPCLETGLNLDAMAILDAGIRSAESGKCEVVDNRTWCIG